MQLRFEILKKIRGNGRIKVSFSRSFSLEDGTNGQNLISVRIYKRDTPVAKRIGDQNSPYKETVYFEPLSSDLMFYSLPYPSCQIEKVLVLGYADRKGNSFLNENLSWGRTLKIIDFLLSEGIRPLSITSGHYGSEKALADIDDLEGRKKDRRVDVVYYLKPDKENCDSVAIDEPVKVETPPEPLIGSIKLAKVKAINRLKPYVDLSKRHSISLNLLALKGAGGLTSRKPFEPSYRLSYEYRLIYISSRMRYSWLKSFFKSLTVGLSVQNFQTNPDDQNFSGRLNFWAYSADLRSSHEVLNNRFSIATSIGQYTWSGRYNAKSADVSFATSGSSSSMTLSLLYERKIDKLYYGLGFERFIGTGKFKDQYFSPTLSLKMER
ncbi:MAG: hypothetical protein EOP06_01555 [Proteobacteria bacterium]|nr:MAG: hypothetical protein EOP06_01555 [Pseudomonadota bacterium]